MCMHVMFIRAIESCTDHLNHSTPQVVCGAGTHTKPKESDSSLMNSEVGAQHTVSEGTEFFVDTVGEQVEV